MFNNVIPDKVSKVPVPSFDVKIPEDVEVAIFLDLFGRELGCSIHREQGLQAYIDYIANKARKEQLKPRKPAPPSIVDQVLKELNARHQ